MRQMRAQGCAISLYDLWIPAMALALRRIAERVKRGGHDVPGEVARRRYRKGLSNLFSRYLPLVDYRAIFDNSSAAPVLVCERDGAIERVSQPATFARIHEQADAPLRRVPAGVRG